MINFIALIAGIIISMGSIGAYQHFNADDETLGAFGDPFLSVQLAANPQNGYILSTDGTDNSWIVNTGGSGGGGGLFEYSAGTDTISPIIASTSNTARLSVSAFTATSTTLENTFPNLNATRSTTTRATTTNLHISNSLSFNSVVGTTWAAFCTSITGTSDLCDDDDNTTYTAGDALTLTGTDIDFDGGTAPGGELGGTWASPTIDDSVAVSSWNLTTPTLTSFFGTPCAGNQFLQDISDTGAFSCATPSGSAGVLGTTSPWTAGSLSYVVDNSTLSSVATGTLTETVSGLELSATRALVGGAAILALSSGFKIPLSASTTNWNGFYDVPSTRITAGTGIDWSGNTLNGVYTAGDALTLNGEDFDFDGGASPGGSLGGTWASPTIDDLFLLNNGDVGTGVYDFGGATSFEIVNGAGCTVDAIGETCFDTTLNAVKVATSTTATVPLILPAYRPVTFNIASSTWGVTTTAEYATLDFNERVTGGRCYTDAGTLLVRVGDGTNWSNQTSITTSTTTVTFSPNNQFNSGGEKVIFQIGTPASSPTRINCSFRGVYETP